MGNMLKLAARNLQRNVRRTIISLSALVLGVTLMVALRGFINGQRVATVDLLVSGTAGALQVHRSGYLANIHAQPLTLDMADSPQLRATMLHVHGVVAVAPRISFGAMLAIPDGSDAAAHPDAQGRTAYVSFTAIDPQAERQVTPKRFDWLAQGRVFEAVDADEVVVSAELNRGLAAPLMSQHDALPPVESWPGIMAADRDGAMNGANVRLVGTLNSVLPGDRRVGLVALGTAQKVLRMQGRVTEFAVAVDAHPLDMVALEQLKAELQSALGTNYEVTTWQDIMPFMKDGLKTQDAVFNILIGTFMLIALLGIVNAMLMSVLERVREIGTMLAVGARRRQVVTMFIFEGMLQGLIGALTGAGLGYLLIAWLNARGVSIRAPGGTVEIMLRPFIGADFVLFAAAVATLGSAVAAFYPAWRASTLRPVEALAST